MLNYVEEVTESAASELLIFHGSNIEFDHIDLEKSHNRRDFRRGFYCTILETQAREWAHRFYMRYHAGGEYVYQYLPLVDKGYFVKQKGRYPASI